MSFVACSSNGHPAPLCDAACQSQAAAIGSSENEIPPNSVAPTTTYTSTTGCDAQCRSDRAVNPTAPTIICDPATLDDLAQVGDGLTTPKGRGLYDGVVVSLDSPIDGYTRLIAARVNTGTDQPIGVWAVGSPYINSLNAVALKYTRWGRAAEPGSQTFQERDQLAMSAEYKAAVACVPSA